MVNHSRNITVNSDARSKNFIRINRNKSALRSGKQQSNQFDYYGADASVDNTEMQQAMGQDIYQTTGRQNRNFDIEKNTKMSGSLILLVKGSFLGHIQGC